MQAHDEGSHVDSVKLDSTNAADADHLLVPVLEAIEAWPDRPMVAVRDKDRLADRSDPITAAFEQMASQLRELKRHHHADGSSLMLEAARATRSTNCLLSLKPDRDSDL